MQLAVETGDARPDRYGTVHAAGCRDLRDAIPIPIGDAGAVTRAHTHAHAPPLTLARYGAMRHRTSAGRPPGDTHAPTGADTGMGTGMGTGRRVRGGACA